jgi:hypothetical protein
VRNDRHGSPHRSFRWSTGHLDNVILVPASLLPYKEHWQHVANALPRGDILIVLPWKAKHQHVARSVASQLREKEKHVRVMHKALQQNEL